MRALLGTWPRGFGLNHLLPLFSPILKLYLHFWIRIWNTDPDPALNFPISGYRQKFRIHHAGLGIRSFQKIATFLRSFLFFIKECDFLFRSFEKNVLFKRTFFLKERGALCVLALFAFFSDFFIKDRGILFCLYKSTRRSLHSF